MLITIICRINLINIWLSTQKVVFEIRFYIIRVGINEGIANWTRWKNGNESFDVEFSAAQGSGTEGGSFMCTRISKVKKVHTRPAKLIRKLKWLWYESES